MGAPEPRMPCPGSGGKDEGKRQGASRRTGRVGGSRGCGKGRPGGIRPHSAPSHRAGGKRAAILSAGGRRDGRNRRGPAGRCGPGRRAGRRQGPNGTGWIQTESFGNGFHEMKIERATKHPLVGASSIFRRRGAKLAFRNINGLRAPGSRSGCELQARPVRKAEHPPGARRGQSGIGRGIGVAPVQQNLRQEKPRCRRNRYR